MMDWQGGQRRLFIVATNQHSLLVFRLMGGRDCVSMRGILRTKGGCGTVCLFVLHVARGGKHGTGWYYVQYEMVQSK